MALESPKLCSSYLHCSGNGRCAGIFCGSRFQLDDISVGDVASTDRSDPSLWWQLGDSVSSTSFFGVGSTCLFC